MRPAATISALATVTVALGLAVTGCGGDGGGGDGATATTSAQTTDATAATGTTGPTTAAPVGAATGQTVGEYLTARGVTQTIVKANEPGVPAVDLPMPDGWEAVTDAADVPPDAYGAIYLSSAKETPNPPAILVRMARLEGGSFDVDTILELAPNAVTRLPGWQGPAQGTPDELGGYPASAIAGTAEVDGVPNFVARKTVVINGADHTYLLALDAQGPAGQQQVLTEAMTVIDAGTTIRP